jgi:hypothetical protein
MRLDVNTDASIKLTAKLEKLHRSAFPNAVRFTLNDAAFESKKLIPEKASKEFTIRQKNLFKKMSIVEKAKGWNINNMVSKVGIDGSMGSLSDGLEKQETGGNLKGRKLTPHNLGRISGNYAKKLKVKNHFSKIDKIGTKNKREKGSKYFRIDKGNKGTVFEQQGKKIVPIYNYRSNPISKLKKRPFLQPSALEAAKRMEQFYFKNAQYQFKKYLR